MNETQETDNNGLEGALVPPNNQVSEAVTEAIASLEARAIKWSDILDVMSNLAFQREQYHLWDVMATSSHQVWETEN